MTFLAIHFLHCICFKSKTVETHLQYDVGIWAKGIQEFKGSLMWGWISSLFKTHYSRNKHRQVLSVYFKVQIQFIVVVEHTASFCHYSLNYPAGTCAQLTVDAGNKTDKLKSMHFIFFTSKLYEM